MMNNDDAANANHTHVHVQRNLCFNPLIVNVFMEIEQIHNGKESKSRRRIVLCLNNVLLIHPLAYG